MSKSFLYSLILLAGIILIFNACEHLQTPPQNYRGGSCDPNTIYFTNDVAPILVSNCAKSGCHDAKSHEEGVILDSYDNIIKTAGIKTGNGQKSDLIKTMRKTSSTMPPTGKLDDSEIAKVSKWIDQGALNNQCIPGCDSTRFAYAADISVIINQNCIGCHGSNNRILLNTYEEVKIRMDDGSLWGAINHLYGYQAMPTATTKLSECDINKFRDWKASGYPK